MINLDNTTILVTGGCGFIGSNFIEYINKHNKKVNIINIDKWGVGHRKLSTVITSSTNTYQEIAMDLRDLCADSNVFWNGVLNKYKFDYIFHFAAESHVDRSINSPDEFMTNNILGMIKLLEMVRLHQPQARVINVSTDEVYGHLNEYQSPFTESSDINPRSPYSASKASADLIAKSYVHTYGLDIVTTHCCNNFGPHQHDEKLIPTIVRHLINDEFVPMYGNGKNIREWIYVDDHNKSILEIAELGKSGLSYNIGSGVEKTNIEMVIDIADILKKPIVYDAKTNTSNLFKFVDDRKGHDFRYAIESVRYQKTFKLEPHMKALEKTVIFYKNKYEKK